MTIVEEIKQLENYQGKIHQVWVKTKVSKRDWKNKFSESPAYCYLGEADGGVIIGFVVGRPENKSEAEILNEYKDRIALCNDDDMRIIQLYRERNNILPQPLSEEKPKIKEKNSPEVDYTIRHGLYKGKNQPQEVGIAEFRLKDNFTFNIKGYPEIYRIKSKEEALKYPKQIIKGNILRIIPLKNLEVVK